MYEQSAAYYDLIYRDLKDYRDEAAKIDALLKRFDPTPQRLLDVGCGTGSHAHNLVRNFGYQVDGLDIQPTFIEIARRKLPSSLFEVGDMRNFDLGKKYQAILCLFSSIGYVETLQGLKDALRSFARHLEPNGLLVCEPWVSPENWTPGLVDVTTANDSRSGTSIVRTREGATDGNVSVMNIEYDISNHQGNRHFTETHRLGLFSAAAIGEALHDAGFEFTWGDHGLQNGRILFAKLAQKSGQK